MSAVEDEDEREIEASRAPLLDHLIELRKRLIICIVGFGLGFAVVDDAATGRVHATEGECSWGGLASTAFWVDPVEEISAVFLTQLVPSGTHVSLRWDLRTLVNQAIVD